MADVEQLIQKAKSLLQEDREQEAWSIADQLLKHHPEDLSERMLRGYLATMGGQNRDAVTEYSHAISITPLEPHLFMERGLNRLEVSEFVLAEEDFSEGLRVCDFHAINSYRNALHFYVPKLDLEQGKKKLASSDLEPLDEDFRLWTHKGLGKRNEMIDACES